jgi:hypothetical protein
LLVPDLSALYATPPKRGFPFERLGRDEVLVLRVQSLQGGVFI